MHYMLLYDYVDDYPERRTPLRPVHLAHAQAAVERGELVLGGAFADQPYAGVLVFSGDSAAVAERFAANDPYVREGLVRKWQVRQWVTVVGRDAAAPVAIVRS